MPPRRARANLVTRKRAEERRKGIWADDNGRVSQKEVQEIESRRGRSSLPISQEGQETIPAVFLLALNEADRD